VIMTTHILEVAERMADRIGVMADGALVAEGTLEDLRRLVGSRDANRTDVNRGDANRSDASLGHASLEDTFLALTAREADPG